MNRILQNVRGFPRCCEDYDVTNNQSEARVFGKLIVFIKPEKRAKKVTN